MLNRKTIPLKWTSQKFRIQWFIFARSLSPNDKTFANEDIEVILLNSWPASYKDVENAVHL